MLALAGPAATALGMGVAGLGGLPWAGVGVAGAAGALARYGVGRLMQRLSVAFPWGTFTINTSGCLLFAVLGGIALRDLRIAGFVSLYLVTGFVGAFTTFSTFELEADLLAAERPGRAALYVVGSTAAGFAAIALGYLLAAA